MDIRNEKLSAMLRILIILSVFTFSATQLIAQGKGGAIIYTGITNATSKDDLFTPEGTAITGYHVGLDARLFSGTMFFGGGIQYHNLTLLATSDAEYFTPKQAHKLIKTRFGLGFNIHQFTHLITLRAKAYGSFNFNLEYDPDLVPYEYTGAYAGAIGGIGVDISFISIDIEYEKGLVNAISKRPDSKLDIWTLSLGVFF